MMEQEKSLNYVYECDTERQTKWSNCNICTEVKITEERTSVSLMLYMQQICCASNFQSIVLVLLSSSLLLSPLPARILGTLRVLRLRSSLFAVVEQRERERRIVLYIYSCAAIKFRLKTRLISFPWLIFDEELFWWNSTFQLLRSADDETLSSLYFETFGKNFHHRDVTILTESFN